MEYRQLGNSGLKVPVLSFGTATFSAGTSEGAWGNTQIDEAKRLVDISLDAGVNFFDSADIYSDGRAEQVLGAAVAGRRDEVLIGTKATFRTSTSADINDVGSSRFHLIRALEGSLRRLGTDYVDVYYLHGFDALTPQEETLSTLDEFVRSGKVRYIGASNFSGWHLMKSLSVSERYGWARHVAHQAHYSLAAREFEWELMPLGIDQGVGTVVWSPLAQGRLTGKIRRGQPVPAGSRLTVGSETEQSGDPETLFRTVDVLDELAAETGKSLAQVALNWVLQRPTVATIVFGARTEEQFRENLGAVGWNLSVEQVARLDAASATTPIYPYWHQRSFSERNPFPTSVPARGEL
ncbi:aldo/keto reductase [Lacisediminihabitans changchengi]|uniref:Aldo/keto reductase n=1 Tax=Lacisediminihabitans changchengi TaxID=2787634 RepID=A0A934VYV5_9MICO|nr:aldo/keto reductase [Lacisediminihabitans changchengi]MBK4348452.1 aldo/keto reductase [Lacisediminihabitans changchengi]